MPCAASNPKSGPTQRPYLPRALSVAETASAADGRRKSAHHKPELTALSGDIDPAAVGFFRFANGKVVVDRVVRVSADAG